MTRHALLLHRDPELARRVRGILEPCGITVAETPDGLEGVELAVERPPDLLLADVTLRRLNGLDALRIIKAARGLAHVPFVVLTDRAEPEDVKDAVELGAVDFILKETFFTPQGAERILKAAGLGPVAPKDRGR